MNQQPIIQKGRNVEALDLTQLVLQNIELGELPLSKVIMRAIRLARLMGHIEVMEWLSLELSGYPSTPLGVPQREWLIAAKSKRHYQEKDKAGTVNTYMYCESVGRIEAEIESSRIQLQVSVDPNISVSSANPHQTVYSPMGNTLERAGLRTSIVKWTSLLDKIKAATYDYVLQTYYQLKFGDISESIFERTRNRVNTSLVSICPLGIKELVSAYDNLASGNESDWSNAANSCRRLLKELADVLYPAKSEKEVKKGGHKLTEDAYKNRLIAFIESKSQSDTYNQVVGSQLKYATDRLDAINEYQSKGVHKKITKEEAERLVIYTYLIVGDILTLVTTEDLPKPPNTQQQDNPTTEAKDDTKVTDS